jgi:hypothetical protein
MIYAHILHLMVIRYTSICSCAVSLLNLMMQVDYLDDLPDDAGLLFLHSELIGVGLLLLIRDWIDALIIGVCQDALVRLLSQWGSKHLDDWLEQGVGIERACIMNYRRMFWGCFRW